MESPKNTKSKKVTMRLTRLWKALRSALRPGDSSNRKNDKLRKCASANAHTNFNSLQQGSPASNFPKTPPRAFSYPPVGRTLIFGVGVGVGVNYNNNMKGKCVRDDGRKQTKRPLSSEVCSAPASPTRFRVFRGKSVMDNSVMRKSVMEEEAMLRKMQIEIQKREKQQKIDKETINNAVKRRHIGPSPLRHVVSASASPLRPCPV